MAKSALLKSSLAKKYWMALTGLFLCLFLTGHLAGNLQLIFGTQMQFNEYALFMTSNPAVKLLSYLTYISIIFHSIDGIILTIQNKKARPIGYVKNNPSANSGVASRNMAVLGTVILVFIATHMVTFWAKMHFDEKFPLQTVKVDDGMGGKTEIYIGSEMGKFYPVDTLMLSQNGLEIRNQKEFWNKEANLKMGEGIKDLHTVVFKFFKDAKLGLFYTIFYVLAMVIMGFHLWHGFQSAFQSLGVNSSKITPIIKLFGKAFAVVVPLLFAIIPLYIHFSK